MNVEKTGYCYASVSGRTLKLYIGTHFIGLLSFADIEKCKKSRNFVAAIFKVIDEPAIREADPALLEAKE